MINTAINLNNLPAPDVIQTMTFEEIFSELLADLQNRDAAFSALLESDPAYKQLQAYAYREMLLRQRVNDAARANMLAHTSNADLDNLAAFSQVERQTIIPADPDAVPPVAAVMESDEAFLYRAVLAWEGITTAGSAGSYIFHSLSADSRVQDAAVNPDGAAGVVDVAVLAYDSADNAAVVAAVDTALDADNIRPLTDNVNVTAAVENTYNVTAALTIKDGVSSDIVLTTAETALDTYAAQCARLGVTIALSGILAALHNDGVVSVDLTAPAADLVPAWNTVYKLDVKTISQA